MSPNINDNLEEINRKLQQIVENLYLSRLDLMFSVLLSLTVFLIGLVLNNTLPRSGLLSVFWLSILTVLVYTLIGEFLAIIRNDIIGRFKFWTALAFDFITLGFFVLFVSLITLSFSSILFLISVYLFPFLCLLLPLSFLFFLGYIHSLFGGYIKRFPSKFDHFPDEEWRKLLLPTAVGYILLCISFMVAYYYLVMKV